MISTAPSELPRWPPFFAHTWMISSRSSAQSRGSSSTGRRFRSSGESILSRRRLIGGSDSTATAPLPLPGEDELGQGAQRVRAGAEGLERRQGALEERLRPPAGALASQGGGAGGLPLGDVLPRGLAERGGVGGEVEQVVRDLEGEAEVEADRVDVLGAGAGAE